MVKHNLEVIYYHFKKDKWMVFIILIVIYALSLPICLHQLQQRSTIFYSSSSIMTCFNEMQKSILLMALLIQSILFKSFVDIEYKDVIYSLDLKRKSRYIVLYTLCTLIILLPFYTMIYLTNQMMIPYIMINIFQIIIISSLYYCLSMITKSTLVSTSALIVYLLFFTFLYQEKSLINMILLNQDYLQIPMSYYISSSGIAFMGIVIGNYFERQFKHK